MRRLLRATEHVYGYLWQKNEVILLSRSRDQLRTNLKNFENPTHPQCFLNKFLLRKHID